MLRLFTWYLRGALILSVAIVGQAIAQTPAPSAAQPAEVKPSPVEGWRFSLTPYIWVPATKVNGGFSVPGGSLGYDSNRTVSETVKDIHFAAMGTGEARNGNFLIATDFIYLDLKATRTTVRSVNLPAAGSVAVGDTGSSADLQATMWTTVVGYTVLHNDAVQADVVAGIRYISVSTDLAWSFTGAAGSVAPSGNASKTIDSISAIAGVKARIRLGDSGFEIPLYADIGGDGSNFSWQTMGGLAYGFSWGELSLNYRYLRYQPRSGPIHALSLSGPLLAATFRF